MTQEWITAVIVFVAAAYALWYWLPAGLRQRLGRVHRTLAQVPGCGDCSSSCGGCAQADETPKFEAGKFRIIPMASQPPSER